MAIKRSLLVRSLKGHSRLWLGVVGGVVIGGLSSAAVMAAIPGSGGVIHACYKSGGLLANGAVRIIDSPSQSCNGTETAITWNQTGPVGPAGPTGPQGPAGSEPGSFLGNLVGADFSSADLRYRNFAGADLHSAKFGGANLTGSNFSNANLTGGSLRGDSTKITNTNFSGVNLTGATLGNDGGPPLDISSTNFTGVNWNGAIFWGSLKGDFHAFNLNGAVLKTASFFDSDLRGIDFRNLVFSSTEDSPTSVSFNSNSNVSNANFSNMTFNNSIGVNQSNMSNADFSNTTFHNDTFEGDIANGTNFTNATFDGSDEVGPLSGASFIGTDLSNAILTGVTWIRAYCPDGTYSVNNGGTCIGHLVP